MCKYPIFMALVLLDRKGRLHLLPRLLWDGRAPFLPGDHPPPQLHPQTEGKGTFSLQTGLSPACGAASTGKAAGCEVERSKKTFRKVCHMSGAFPAGHIHGRHIQHPRLLSTSSRSGSHASPCKGSTQPDRRAHAPAVAADSLAKAFCWVFHLQPPAFLCSGTLLLPSAENPPVLSQKQRLPASESPRMSLLIPAWDFGVTKDTLMVPHTSFCPRTAFGILPAWGWEEVPDQALVGHQPGQKPHLDAWSRQCRQEVTVPSQKWLGTRQGAKEHDSGTISGSETA